METAADKLSALTWRVLTRQRGAIGEDATLIRHLHDLAALKSAVEVVPAFTTLVFQAAAADAGRGGEATASSDPATLFANMIDRLRSGVRDGTLNSILFPQDVVANANRILSDLRQVFPPTAGRFIFGPMARLAWGGAG